MTNFVNNLDGSKVAIFCSFFLALVAMLFIGFHIVFADGSAASAEVQFLEGVVQGVLVAGGGISTVHVVTGAVVSAKNKNGQQPPQQTP